MPQTDPSAPELGAIARRLNAYDRREGLDVPTQAIECETGAEVLRALDQTVEDGGSEIAPFAQGAFAAMGGAPLWITHEMEWLYPDNPYLWRFFLHYARERVHPGHGTPGATHFHDATLEVQHR